MIEYDEEGTEELLNHDAVEMVKESIDSLLKTHDLQAFHLCMGRRNGKKLMAVLVMSEVQKRKGDYVLDSYGNEVHVGDEVSFDSSAFGKDTRGIVAVLLPKEEAVIVNVKGTVGYVLGQSYGVKDFRLVDKEDSYNEMGSNQ